MRKPEKRNVGCGQAQRRAHQLSAFWWVFAALDHTLRPTIRKTNAMCGIVGYVGPREAIDYLITGLRRLEYRGYDSSGVALITAERHLTLCKSAGRIDRLEARLAGSEYGCPPRPDGHRPHPLGHPRRAERHQRPPPPGRRRRDRRRSQRRDRELPVAQAPPCGRGLYVPFGHRYRGHRPPGGKLFEAAAARGGHGGAGLPAPGRRRARGLAATPGDLRPDDPLPRLARRADRRPLGQSRSCWASATASISWPATPRLWRATPTRSSTWPTTSWPCSRPIRCGSSIATPGTRRSAHPHPGTQGRRHRYGRLPALYAQGDLRAAGVDRERHAGAVGLRRGDGQVRRLESLAAAVARACSVS